MLKRRTVIHNYINDKNCISLDKCYAKTCRSGDMQSFLYGKTVDSHCKIVGKIAKYLLNNYCSKSVVSLLPKSSPLIVAVHDIGKISPTFQLKLAKAIFKNSWKTEHPELCPYENYEEQLFGGHPTVSYAFLRNINESVALVAGQHHGSIHPQAEVKVDCSDGFGGEPWANLRKQEFENLCKFFESCLECKLTSTQISLLSGLTCVSDWIGSGYFFDNPIENSEGDISKAVESAGFNKFVVKKNLSFNDIFGFSPNPTQETFVKRISSPGVYVIEAPMGLGKTELALYAAYKLLSTGQASGIYFALPTQLTSNKIWSRVSDFLSSILTVNTSGMETFLLHSNSHLIQNSFGEDCLPGNSWFSSAKRKILYPFSVGTVDQALLAVMKVRHSFVRSFGLAGKVVIIDEVHTYDCYTGSILNCLVKHLVEIGCTVIILSATLNGQRRAELLNSVINSESYPVMSYKKELSSNAPALTVESNNLVSSKVNIAFKSFSECKEECFKRATTGQQILWIENTVVDAQKSYDELSYLAKELGVECGLIHSRYIPVDRDKKESYWVELLGKNTSKDDRSSKGRILVGTQVLEQSLDIDADFLISRFAPTDMILQRIGRLWRHSSTVRPNGSKREMWFIDVNLKECVQTHGEEFGLSSCVYSPYILCRSLEVFKNVANKGFISIPSDVRSLINETYCPREERNENYRFMFRELHDGSKKRKGINSLNQLARNAVAETGVVLNDDNAPTRYSEELVSQILIISDIRFLNNSIEIEFPNGKCYVLFYGINRQSKQAKEIAVELMKHIVLIRKSIEPSTLTVGQAIKLGLDNYLYIGDKKDLSQSSGISLMILQSTGKLQNYNEFTSEKYDYIYSYEKGLEAIKSNDK